MSNRDLEAVTIVEAKGDLNSIKNIITVAITRVKHVIVKSDLGLYYWNPASTRTPNDINVIKPDDVTIPAAGRWVKLEYTQTHLDSRAPTANDDYSTGILNGDPWLDTITNFTYICKDNTTGSAVWIEVEGSMATPEVNQFTATAGQTAFTLTSTPTYPTKGILTLNGQEKIYGTDYTVSGTSLTWLDNPVLITGDKLNYYYSYESGGGGGGAVSSVFTRAGDVMAQVSDYDASQIDNDSVVSGSFVSDALNTLDSSKEPTLTKGNIVGTLNQINVLGGSNAIIGSGVTLSLPSGFFNKEHHNQPNYDSNYGIWKVERVAGSGIARLPIDVPSDARVINNVIIEFFVSSGADGSGKNIDLTSEYCEVGQLFNQYTQSDTTSTYDLTGFTDKLYSLDVTSLFTNLAAGMQGTLFFDTNSIGGNLYIVGTIVKYTI